MMKQNFLFKYGIMKRLQQQLLLAIEGNQNIWENIATIRRSNKHYKFKEFVEKGISRDNAVAKS